MSFVDSPEYYSSSTISTAKKLGPTFSTISKKTDVSAASKKTDVSAASKKTDISATTKKTDTATTTTTTLATTAPNPKASNVFYFWYMELCRRQQSQPLGTLRSQHQKNDRVLDIYADRIKLEDWPPITNALRLDSTLHVISLHSKLGNQKLIDDEDTVDSKDKKKKVWFRPILMKGTLGSLLKGISLSMKKSEVLSCLELEGFPIRDTEYVLLITQAVSQNQSLKYLSFKGCPIGDAGCMEVCNALHLTPNIECINMSSCELGVVSAERIAKLIKYQQLNRYCESWHSSLRYENPSLQTMAGLKRITINNNPDIGDDGLKLILDEIVDDLWIKAIDMQRCNITEDLGERLIDVIGYNKSIVVADFRNNPLSEQTMELILKIIKDKDNDNGSQTEYQWCISSTTLTDTCFGSYTSLLDTGFNFSFGANSAAKSNKNSLTSKKGTTNIKLADRSSIAVDNNNKKVGAAAAAAAAAVQKKNPKEQQLKNHAVASAAAAPGNIVNVAVEKLGRILDALKMKIIRCGTARGFYDEMKTKFQCILDEARLHGTKDELKQIKVTMVEFIHIIKNYGNITPRDRIIEELIKIVSDEPAAGNKPYEEQELFEQITNTPKSDVSDEESIKVRGLFKTIKENNSRTQSALDLDLDLSSRGSTQRYDNGEEYDEASSSDSEMLETYRKLLNDLLDDEEAA